MSKILTLVKTYLLQRYRLDRNTGKKGKIIALTVGLTVGILPMAVFMFILIFSMGKVARYLNITTQILTLNILAMQAIVFFFGIASLLNTIYLAKDTSILLPLPLRPTQIFVSKLIYVYLTETLASIALAIVMLLPFGIGANMAWWYYPQMLLVILILPMLPLLIASIVAIPLMWFVSFFKNKGVITTLVYLLIFSMALLGYYYLISRLNNVPEDGGGFEHMLGELLERLSRTAKLIYPDYLLATSLTATTIWQYLMGLFGSLVINVVLLCGSVGVSSLVYRKSVSGQLEISKGSTKRDSGNYVKRGRVFSLIATDIKQIMGDTAMGTSCCMCVVLAPLMAIVLPVVYNMDMSMFVDVPHTLIEIGASVVIMSIFSFMTLSTNMVATSSFTREAQGLFIYKTMPIDARTIVKSKVLIAVVFSFLASALSVIPIGITFKVSIAYLLPTIAVTWLYLLGAIYLQVRIDLAKPRLVWNTFNEGAKNNPSALWSMLFGFITLFLVAGIGALFAYLWYIINSVWLIIVMYALLAVIGIVYTLLARRSLYNNCDKLYSRLEG
ncbi:MAG: hypothetical protein PHW00_02840 [Clostridia bacterium]|nr:hypothetical protein [Clostridia bacterium]